ncbi:hypothetical protein [Microbispora sp. NPDC049125]|uniref:hypothetical protein n=1 Tax=Microbispora sp. NPDC049125 TaxID=3154929 RepID=UPI003466E450
MMRLTFTPCEYPNDLGGTDIRDGNGDLQGSTARTADGYTARLGADGPTLDGTYDTDSAAQFAILTALATAIPDEETDQPAPELITSYAANAAHTRATCSRCKVDYDCDEKLRLRSAMYADLAARRTPYVAASQWGRKTGFWEERPARAWASVQRGEFIDQTHLYRIA